MSINGLKNGCQASIFGSWDPNADDGSGYVKDPLDKDLNFNLFDGTMINALEFSQSTKQLTVSNDELVWGGVELGGGDVENPMTETLQGAGNKIENVTLLAGDNDGNLIPVDGKIGMVSKDDDTKAGWLDVSDRGDSLLFNGTKVTASNGDDSHNLKYVKAIEFITDVDLSTSQESSEVSLLLGGNRIASYAPSNNNSGNMPRVQYGGASGVFPYTSFEGEDQNQYPLNIPKNYPVVQGNFIYNVNTDLTLDQYGWAGVKRYEIYCSSVDLTSANSAYPQNQPPTTSDKNTIKLPSDALMICSVSSQVCNHIYNGTRAKGSFTFTSEANLDSPTEVLSYGYNQDRCAGKDYLYVVVQGSYTNSSSQVVPYKVVNFGCILSRSFADSSISLTNGTGSLVSSLHLDSSGNLLNDGKEVVSEAVSSIQTEDDTETTIASHQIDEGTAGLLQAYAYSDSSAWRVDGHVSRDSGGSVVVSGSMVHEIANPNSHTLTLSGDADSVLLKVVGESNPVNWGARWTYHQVSKWVDPGYGESLYFPLVEDLDDDIVPVSPATLISGDWYQFTDSSLEFQSLASGAHYSTTGADMDLNTNFSMSFWVNIPAVTNPYNGMFLSTTQPADNNHTGWRLMTYSNNLDWSIHRNSGAIVVSRVPYTALKGAGWTHLVYTYDGSSDDSVADSLKAYWNNEYKGSGIVGGGSFSKSSPLNFPGGNFSITAKNSSHQFGGWKISHLRFWKRVITAEEIAKLASERA